MVRLIYVHIFGTQCLNPELSIQTRSIIVYVLSYMQTHKYAYICIHIYVDIPIYICVHLQKEREDTYADTLNP